MDEKRETYADQIGHEKFMELVEDFFKNHYKDRGMVKWQGFYLSDHTAALKRQAEEEAVEYEPLDKMPEPDVRHILNRAYANHNSVEIQIADVSQDIRMFPPMKGKVAGTDGQDGVVLDDGTRIQISHIRNIRMVPLPGEPGYPTS